MLAGFLRIFTGTSTAAAAAAVALECADDVVDVCIRCDDEDSDEEKEDSSRLLRADAPLLMLAVG